MLKPNIGQQTVMHTLKRYSFNVCSSCKYITKVYLNFVLNTAWSEWNVYMSLRMDSYTDLLTHLIVGKIPLVHTYISNNYNISVLIIYMKIRSKIINYLTHTFYNTGAVIKNSRIRGKMEPFYACMFPIVPDS